MYILRYEEYIFNIKNQNKLNKQYFLCQQTEIETRGPWATSLT